MAETILDYLKEYGKYSLQEKPINDVDSLILCQLSYLKFDEIVPDVRQNLPSITIEEIAAHKDYEKLFADERFEKDNRALFHGILNSRRFKKLKLNYYINQIVKEKEWEMQFSAVTCFLENNMVYIAYRGTDETIVGWKEDFNMAFLSPVPGQLYSTEYLNLVAGKIKGSFLVGGHSKGGNFAVYAAMKCSPEIQKRILKIYSMDGPGFRAEVLKEEHYERIEKRVVKILPHSSFVGMIFEKNIHYYVVESKTFGLAQHNPFSWLVKDGDFVWVEDIYESRRKLDNTLNEWILSLNQQQLQTFVDTLYQVISASEAQDLIEFTADWKKSMNHVIRALKEVDGQTAHMLKDMIKSLFDIAAMQMKEGFHRKEGFSFKKLLTEKKTSKEEEVHH